MRFSIGTALLVLVPLAVDAKPARFEIDVPKSSLIVDVHPTGKMSRVSHELHLYANKWHGSFTFDRERPELTRGEIVVEANSLQERADDLNDSEKKKINQAVSSAQVLDAQRYPTIRFGFDRFDVLSQKDGRFRGTLVGTLTLHGVSRPITIPARAVQQKDETLRVFGNASLEQTKFGIRPYSTPLGTQGIQDRVEVRFDVTAEAK